MAARSTAQRIVVEPIVLEAVVAFNYVIPYQGDVGFLI